MKPFPIKKDHPLGMLLDRETAERLGLPCIVVGRPPKHLGKPNEDRSTEGNNSGKAATLTKMQQELDRDPEARTARRITLEVALKHRLTMAEILSKTRSWKIVDARNEAFFRCQDELGMSTNAIGKRFGLDHSSVIHGIKRHMNPRPRKVSGKNLFQKSSAKKEALQ